MSGEIKVNTVKVTETAESLETKNGLRHESLLQKQTDVNKLADDWTAKSAAAVIPAFYQLGSKHFQGYSDKISSYTAFLKKVVAQGYTKTEDTNTGLAEAFDN